MDGFWIISAIILIIFGVRFFLDNSEKKFKQLVGIYVAWAFINLIFLVSSDKDSSGFFPDRDNIDSYDYAEFLVYVFGPLLLIYVRGLMKG